MLSTPRTPRHQGFHPPKVAQQATMTESSRACQAGCLHTFRAIIVLHQGAHASRIAFRVIETRSEVRQPVLTQESHRADLSGQICPRRPNAPGIASRRRAECAVVVFCGREAPKNRALTGTLQLSGATAMSAPAIYLSSESRPSCAFRFEGRLKEKRLTRIGGVSCCAGGSWCSKDRSPAHRFAL